MFDEQDDLGPFGASNTLHEDQLLWDKDETDNSTKIEHQIMWYAISPISLVGVVLNSVVILVWSMKASHQPIVFLFKVLAVFDNVYIISFNVWWYCPTASMATFVMAGVAFGSQYMLVNTILLISVWRWIGVFFQQHSRRLLTHFRAKVAAAIIVGYCAGLKFAERVVTYNVRDKSTINVMSVVTGSVLLSTPLIVQAAMMVCLICALRKKSNVLPDVSSTGHVHFRTSSPLSSYKVLRLSYTVIFLTVFTFIVYPINGVVGAYFKLSPSYDNEYVKKLVNALIHMLQIINSCLPFFFYFIFMLKFRRQCLLTFITVYTGTYASTVPSECEIPAEIPDFPDHRRTSYHRSTVVVGEDGTLTVTEAPRPGKEEGIEEQPSTDVQDSFPSSNPAVDWASFEVKEQKQA